MFRLWSIPASIQRYRQSSLRTTSVNMSDSEEVWQVARQRRRRRRSVDSKAEQQQHQPEIRRIPAREAATGQNHAASHSSRRNKTKSKTVHGYSYSETGNGSGLPPLEQTVDKGELVRAELAKLEQLKELLRETALWQRLVEGFEHILPQLGLAAPGRDEVFHADRVSTMSGIPADSSTTSSCPRGMDVGGDTDNDRTSAVSQRLVLCELVCYGIGNFSENHSSRYQLAFALCLRDLLLRTSKNTGVPEEAAAVAAASTKAQSLVGLDSNAGYSELMQRQEQEQQSDGKMAPPSKPGAKTAEATLRWSSPGSTQTYGSSSSHSTDITHSPNRQERRVSRKGNLRGAAMLVFDPVMGETERAILAALGCGTLENEEGKRCCCRCCETGGEAGNEGGCGDKTGEEGRKEMATPTLFFMPHCPQRLYSNVLWANWCPQALGSMLILGNNISSYGDRLLGARARGDPTNALLRAGPLLQDLDLLPYPASDKARWRRDVEKLPRLERAFNDLALSFSSPNARDSAEGVKALLDRPQEFVEEADGELVTGRVGGRFIN